MSKQKHFFEKTMKNFFLGFYDEYKCSKEHLLELENLFLTF